MCRDNSQQNPKRRRAKPGRLYLPSPLLFIVTLTALVGGCESNQNDNGMADSFYLNPHKDLRTLGRVALVELDNRSAYPKISADMTDALFAALQKRHVFGLSVVRQDDQTWRSLQENLDSLQGLRQLLTMREALNCNGLLVGTITEYQPYPRLSIGLRLKLIDLTDGQLLWGLEQVWDTADASIRRRIQQYSNRELGSGSAPLQDEIVTISSLRFGRFVAHEVAETLDRRGR